MYLPPNIIQEYRIEPIAPELPWFCLHPHLDILQGCRRLSLVVLVKQWIVDQLTPPKLAPVGAAPSTSSLSTCHHLVLMQQLHTSQLCIYPQI